MQADSFIAGKWLGKDLLGAYSVAMHLASLPNQRISSLIGQVAFPAFSRVQHDRKMVASYVLLGVRVLSLFSFPIFWGLSSVASEFVQVILGPKWLASTIPLQIISLVMPLRTINTFVPNAIQGLGRFDVALKNVVLSFAIFVLAFTVGVQWGLLGLCLAWLVAMPIASLITMRINMRILETPMKSFFLSMGRPAIAALLMYCTISLCRSTVLSSVSDPSKLALSIIVGFVAYVGLIRLIDRAGFDELIGLLRELTGRRER
jgi:O-antigen/teichoic acid export membrane protein